MKAAILSASVWGPGLCGWAAAAPLLRAGAVAAEGGTVPPPPALLPANERRRAGLLTRLALAVAAEAAADAGIAPAALPAVFASASGDGAVVHDLLVTLAVPEGEVSPTRFHNSVHNAPAGYWSIGAGAQAETASLGAHDETAAAALLAAATAVCAEDEAWLMVVADAPMPAPLALARPIGPAFAAALVLAPEGGTATPGAARRVALALDFIPGAAAWDLPRSPGLAALAAATPAARLLRLLESLAAGRADRFSLPLAGGRLAVTLAPPP